MKTQIPVSNYSLDGVAKGIITVPTTQEIVEDTTMTGAPSWKANYSQIFEQATVDYITPASSVRSVSGSLLFTASVSGVVSDHSVTWSSSGGTWSGNTWTAPAQPGTYTITATSVEDPSASSTAQVVVVAAPVATSITGSANITQGVPSITAVFSNGRGFVDQGIGEVFSGVPFAAPNLGTGTVFTLTVWNTAGAQATKASSAMNVVAVPAITSFTADSLQVTSGNSTNIKGVFTGGTGAVDHGVGAVTNNTPKTTGTLAATTTFTLTVTNAAGTAVTQTITITVV